MTEDEPKVAVVLHEDPNIVDMVEQADNMFGDVLSLGQDIENGLLDIVSQKYIRTVKRRMLRDLPRPVVRDYYRGEYHSLGDWAVAENVYQVHMSGVACDLLEAMLRYSLMWRARNEGAGDRGVLWRWTQMGLRFMTPWVQDRYGLKGHWDFVPDVASVEVEPGVTPDEEYDTQGLETPIFDYALGDATEQHIVIDLGYQGTDVGEIHPSLEDLCDMIAAELQRRGDTDTTGGDILEMVIWSSNIDYP